MPWEVLRWRAFSWPTFRPKENPTFINICSGSVTRSRGLNVSTERVFRTKLGSGRIAFWTVMYWSCIVSVLPDAQATVWVLDVNYWHTHRCCFSLENGWDSGLTLCCRLVSTFGCRGAVTLWMNSRTFSTRLLPCFTSYTCRTEQGVWAPRRKTTGQLCSPANVVDSPIIQIKPVICWFYKVDLPPITNQIKPWFYLCYSSFITSNVIKGRHVVCTDRHWNTFMVGILSFINSASLQRTFQGAWIFTKPIPGILLWGHRHVWA